MSTRNGESIGQSGDWSNSLRARRVQLVGKFAQARRQIDLRAMRDALG